MKAYLKEFWLFVSSGIFLTNFAKMVVVIVGLCILTNWGLRCHTSHGESVQLQDFTGKHLEDAQRQGRDKNFEFEVIDSTAFQPGKPGGIIINQVPAALSRVKEGRKIYVSVTKWVANQVPLPQFAYSSYDFEKYRDKLKIKGIKCEIKERVFDRKLAENYILHFVYEGKKVTEQDIKNGFSVPNGTTLQFVVTERKSNEMEIPNLVCKDYDAAEFLVSTSNLNIGEVNEDSDVVSRGSAYVYRQEPAYDSSSTIRQGSQINVWLKQDLPANCGGSSGTDDNSRENENF